MDGIMRLWGYKDNEESGGGNIEHRTSNIEHRMGKRGIEDDDENEDEVRPESDCQNASAGGMSAAWQERHK